MNLPDAPKDERYTVVVRNLVLMSSIGIRRAEHGRKQRVRVSVELTATPEAGFSGDDRRRVINYEKVVAAIREIAASGHIDLCEGFAARVCDACFADPRVGRVRVRSKSSTFSPRPSRSARSWNAAGRVERWSGPLLVGIVNITADSFSDGGRFLDPAAAIAHARRLAADGADIVELGAASSNVAAEIGFAGRGNRPARPGAEQRWPTMARCSRWIPTARRHNVSRCRGASRI